MRRNITKVRELRQAATGSERIAWQFLRTLRTRGFKFRRQRPIGPWVADFCCPERGLVAELDGSVHAQPSQVRRDAARNFALQQAGYSVLRVPNGIVLQDPDAFLGKVMERALALPDFFGGKRRPPHPRPLSPKEARGVR